MKTQIDSTKWLMNTEGDPVLARPVTRKEWENKHRDFKGIVKGIKYMMYNDNGMATSIPVYIKD